MPPALSARTNALWQIVAPHIQTKDIAHNLQHVERVVRWCVKLAEEANVCAELAFAVGMVHDLVHIPKNRDDRAQGSEASADAAAPLLAEAGFASDEITAVIAAVRDSSWSKGIEASTDLGRVLRDADRLDAIGAIGIARCMATAQSMSRAEAPGSFANAKDPTGSSRPLNDRAYALDHFYRKLLTLSEGMHFESSRAEAARRHAFLERYVEQLVREVSDADSFK